MRIKKTAHLAGLVYLVVVITGIISLAYVPSKLIVWDNAKLTLVNIKTNELMFRLSILSGVICYLAFLILPLLLYRLLKSVDRTQAKLMVLLAIISVPISLINLIHKLNVLSLINGANYLNVFTDAHLATEVMLSLNQYDNGILMVQIFWGLWLFPFGYLVYRSEILPKVLGVFLLIGCFSYLINFIGFFLFPNYAELGISSYVRLPASIGEIGTCLWLLVMGAKNEP
ncbi:DUF4386 domain-containing protein [Pedobacter sp. Du54]|uniref:DUF4386 domain-containing protein n=1 Tax=Pedobacter anseongensis TaxID=3133439 RepID=UPI0030AE0D53